MDKSYMQSRCSLDWGMGLLTNMFLLHLSTAVASNIWGLGKNIPACSTEQQNRHKDFSWTLNERSTHMPTQSSAWTFIVSNLSDLNASDPTVYLPLVQPSSILHMCSLQFSTRHSILLGSSFSLRHLGIDLHQLHSLESLEIFWILLNPDAFRIPSVFTSQTLYTLFLPCSNLNIEVNNFADLLLRIP